MPYRETITVTPMGLYYGRRIGVDVGRRLLKCGARDQQICLYRIRINCETVEGYEVNKKLNFFV